MKIELECSDLSALVITLIERMAKHADFAEEEEQDGGSKFRAAAWRDVSNALSGHLSENLTAALEAALDCIIVEQAVLPPCATCGGQLDRDPGGAVYCSECGRESVDDE